MNLVALPISFFDAPFATEHISAQRKQAISIYQEHSFVKKIYLSVIYPEGTKKCRPRDSFSSFDIAP